LLALSGTVGPWSKNPSEGEAWRYGIGVVQGLIIAQLVSSRCVISMMGLVPMLNRVWMWVATMRPMSNIGTEPPCAPCGFPC
jgi:hypothetical protein